MRSRIHNIVLLASMLLTIVAITSCNNSPEESDQELSLFVKLSSTTPFRAIEEGAKQDTYEVGDFQSITLFFYDAQDNPTEPYRVELKKEADIKKAMSDEGYEIKVRQAVSKVSAVAGRSGIWKATDLDKITIDKLQELNGAEAQKNGFLYKVPYVAPMTEIVPDQANAERLIVTLQPVPNVARLEISGNIEVPLESQENTVKWIIDNKMKTYTQSQTDYSWLPTPEDLMLRSISDVTIRGIYVNNYKETPNVANADRTRLTDDNYNLDGKVWTGHNDAMHTLFGALNETNDYAKKMTTGKVDAYQIYPGKATDDPEALDHIIVAVDYKVHTRVGHFNYKVYNATEKKDVYACTGVEDRGVQTKTRFITIRKFLVTDTNKSLVSFDPGKIYRINLKDLSPLFSTNTNPGIKGTDDIEVIAPRPERTDERPEEETNTIPVSVVDWTHININTELD
ncbi:MAG: hypothetical protein JNG44_02190 [Porphyromonas sp.]|uniref:hypothetical protein n=1 Tax=Porphyromonas sp. TaxID=1924944 RepID=UPI001A4E0074|nr:hypothetical protein [Porphyromonas sp.]MBL6452500.1 hypothetical protein [Porphyromonas sp.]